MLDIISQMTSLFILILVGYAAAKFKITDSRFSQQLSVFVINISNPCLILSSVMGEISPKKELIIPVLAIGFITYAFFVAVSIALSHAMSKDKTMQGIYGFMLTFGNVGFLGFPIVASIFGEHAIFYASLLNVPNTLFIFVVGTVFVLGDGQKMRFNPRTLYCPAMIASYLSIAIVALGWEAVPRVVAEPLHLLGNITVPGALLVIGSSMAQIGRHHILGSPRTYAMAALRLLVIPIAVYALSRAVGVDETVNRINTVLIGMPVSSYGTMFCLKYGRDEGEMVRGTLITTILSVVTIPLLTLLLF